MKNPEEDILKRFLQDTFSDYEPEPSDTTWENIRKEIQPQQPNVGAGFKQWIMPVVALLLLIGGLVWNGNNVENKSELAVNLVSNNDSPLNDKRSDGSRPFEGRLPYSGKILVNKTKSNVEDKGISVVEKSLKLPMSSSTPIEPMVKSAVEGLSLNYENNSINNAGRQFNFGSNPASVKSSLAVVDVLTPMNQHIDDYVSNAGWQFHWGSNPASVKNALAINEIKYIKPLEMLRNKDFVLLKNQINLPQISEISIDRKVKPIRRPVYVSVGVMPLQTYRILTVNSRDIQNLQTNNIFDSERNGVAFDVGITKMIGNKWNFRSNISYLKMHQWAEYQTSTDNIAVRNSNNFSNNITIVDNSNEFIGQSRTERKTLQMIGLKADVQRFFNVTGRNRYFISGGSSLLIEPSEKQTNVFVNASAGFQRLVNKDCFLTIEPTASYLLNNTNDSRSLIQSNAYNVGLKVGVSFRVK